MQEVTVLAVKTEAGEGCSGRGQGAMCLMPCFTLGILHHENFCYRRP